MVRRMETYEYSWCQLRNAMATYFPDDIEEFDALMAGDNKRPAIEMLQNKNIISPDAWVTF